MIPFAALNSLVSDVKKGSLRVNSVTIFVVFVDTCGTGKRNRAGALVLGNGRILSIFLRAQPEEWGLEG